MNITYARINYQGFCVSLQQNNFETLNNVSKLDKLTACYTYFLTEEYRKHIWNILNDDYENNNIAAPSNRRFHESIYQVILTELVRAALDIEGGAVHYSYSDKMLTCSNGYNLNYKQYTQPNWNYLFLVNVINNAFRQSKNVNNISSLLDTTYAIITSDFTEYENYKTHIDKARRDILQYITHLNLIDMINLCKKYKTEYDKCTNLSDITNLQNIDISPRRNGIIYNKNVNEDIVIVFCQPYSNGLNGSKYIGLSHLITISNNAFLYQKSLSCSNQDIGTEFTFANIANEYIAEIDTKQQVELIKFTNMLNQNRNKIEKAIKFQYSDKFHAVKDKFDEDIITFTQKIWKTLKDIVSYDPNLCVYGIPLKLRSDTTYNTAYMLMYYINQYEKSLQKPLLAKIKLNFTKMEAILKGLSDNNKQREDNYTLEQFERYKALETENIYLKMELEDTTSLGMTSLDGWALFVKVLKYVNNVIEESEKMNYQS